MKQMKINIALLSFSIIVLSGACTSKKQERVSEADSTSVETATKPKATGTVFENADASVKESINNLLTSYFHIIHSLANDNESGAKEGAKKLAEDLHGVDTSKLPEDQKAFYRQHESGISRSLDDITHGTNLNDIREATASISEELYQLTKAFHGNTADVYYNYCPMARDNAGAYWLSDVSEIQNPYMGQRMPSCGSTREVLK